MKKIIILFFTVVTASSVYGQSHIEDGDRCFDNGDYACAETKYNEAFKSASGRDKQIAEIKLIRAKNCAEWIRFANQLFSNENYEAAKENYQKVLDSNPKDAYSKIQLEKCNNALIVTLNISKENLSFSSSGGKETITVTSNASSYSANSGTSWCTVQANTGYFVVTCSENLGTATRTGYITVTAGDKTIRIDVSQTGKIPTPPATTLSVSKGKMSFSSSRGNENITVTTNASSYSVNSESSWCTVQKYAGYFVVTYSENSGTTTRTGYITVSAGDKTVRIEVSQTGKVPTQPATTLSVSKEKLSFPSSGGSETISVRTNASSYSLNLLPLWCTVQKHPGYFVITYNANSGSTSRTDYFTVTADGKTVGINVSQAGNISTETTLSVT